MTTILQINSSLHGEDAQSSRLASEFVAALGGTRERRGSTSASGSPVILRDLSSAPVPHLTAEGPVGLLTGKKAYVFATRGGRYAGTAADLQTAYVRQFLGFVGIRDVEFVYAEGLALGADERSAAVAHALARIGQLAA